MTPLVVEVGRGLTTRARQSSTERALYTTLRLLILLLAKLDALEQRHEGMIGIHTPLKADYYIGAIAKPSRQKASSSSSNKKLPTYSPFALSNCWTIKKRRRKKSRNSRSPWRKASQQRITLTCNACRLRLRCLFYNYFTEKEVFY